MSPRPVARKIGEQPGGDRDAGEIGIAAFAAQGCRAHQQHLPVAVVEAHFEQLFRNDVAARFAPEDVEERRREVTRVREGVKADQPTRRA